ncbi:hypothetical protein NUW58_g4661 [Xylaria curta]|uniref:Uncharacterized protein n=1 Tax=Xylaria curta TaxID=42375 RepID=A0ACC1P6Q1_9PEZI|nr:hypothetical protein NUW58_g4661 [Xylaria curta]
MQSRSGMGRYPREPYSESSIIRPDTPLRDLVGFQKGSTDDLTFETLKALHLSPRCRSRGNGSRRAPRATSPGHHNSGIAKRHERLFSRPLAYRPQTNIRANTYTQAVASQASSTASVADSSREQDSSLTTSSPPSDSHHENPLPCTSRDSVRLPDLDANDEAEVQVSASRGADAHVAYEVHVRERAQNECGASGLYDDNMRIALTLLSKPDTEHQANLDAASDDCRDLFLEYYHQTCGGIAAEEESQDDAYWKWDPARQQWFHKDAKTQSVVWFLG